MAALVLAAGGCGGEDESGAGSAYPESELTLAEATAPLQDGSPELREVRAQANEIIAGDLEDFEARLAELEGTPVVVNKWASWCGPCIYEFPHFQEAAIARSDEVAFLGIDFDDGAEAAAEFLARLPVPYPSYSDPDGELSRSLEAHIIPSTVFVGADGQVKYRKLGPYESADELIADIDRYAP